LKLFTAVKPGGLQFIAPFAVLLQILANLGIQVVVRASPKYNEIGSDGIFDREERPECPKRNKQVYDFTKRQRVKCIYRPSRRSNSRQSVSSEAYAASAV
jgi:hypothetical protein